MSRRNKSIRKRIQSPEEAIIVWLRNSINLVITIADGDIDRTPEMRQTIIDLGDPECAYYYSRYIDRYPRRDLRQVACKDPSTALWYSLNVDKKPRKEVREALESLEDSGWQMATYLDWEAKYLLKQKARQKKDKK